MKMSKLILKVKIYINKRKQKKGGEGGDETTLPSFTWIDSTVRSFAFGSSMTRLISQSILSVNAKFVLNLQSGRICFGLKIKRISARTHSHTRTLVTDCVSLSFPGTGTSFSLSLQAMIGSPHTCHLCKRDMLTCSRYRRRREEEQEWIVAAAAATSLLPCVCLQYNLLALFLLFPFTAHMWAYE